MECDVECISCPSVSNELELTLRKRAADGGGSLDDGCRSAGVPSSEESMSGGAAAQIRAAAAEAATLLGGLIGGAVGFFAALPAAFAAFAAFAAGSSVASLCGEPSSWDAEDYRLAPGRPVLVRDRRCCRCADPRGRHHGPVLGHALQTHKPCIRLVYECIPIYYRLVLENALYEVSIQ